VRRTPHIDGRRCMANPLHGYQKHRHIGISPLRNALNHLFLTPQNAFSAILPYLRTYESEKAILEASWMPPNVEKVN
jgi:hypothetical protein